MIDTTIFQDKVAVYYTLGCKLNLQRPLLLENIKGSGSSDSQKR